ncbi:MAG: hypothetical protein K2Q18_11795 [Bdellovibrionales bacterium]|nr:hypothetical protein [Bdellovibrionales bacterium]
MKTLLLLFTVSILSTHAFAETSGEAITTQNPEVDLSRSPAKADGKLAKKVAEKNVKTTGRISSSGCETASGKTLSENDFGYADCVKQVGLKKK